MVAPAIIAASSVPAIVAVVIKAFVGYMIARVVLSLGIALVTFTAADSIATWITSYVQTNIGGLPGDVSGIASAIGLYDAVNIVLSAYVAAIGIKQLKGVYNRLTFGA